MRPYCVREPPTTTPSTAQQGDFAAILLPEPASVEFQKDGFVFSSGDGTLRREGKNWTFDSSVPNMEQDRIAKLLASRKVSQKIENTDVAVSAPLWWKGLGGNIQQIVSFRADSQRYIAAARGNELFLMDEEGKLLKKLAFGDEIGAVAWQASGKRLLVGCKDEKVTAVDLDGRKIWEFTSEMAPEVLKVGPYWHKPAVPGIRSIRVAELTPGKEQVFIGSAGTLEVLDQNGKFEKRLYIQYGPVDNMTVLPSEDGKTASLLLIRSTGGWPFVHSVSPGLQVKNLGMTRDASNTDMGAFGFSSVGKTILFPVRFTNDGPVHLVGDFSGAHNRVMVWNRNGQALADANLGIDKAGSAIAPYGSVCAGQRHIKFIGVDDFDGDGAKEIAAVTRRKRIFFWTPEMKLKQMLVLPGMPLTAATSHGKVFIGFDDGRIYSADGNGNLSLIGCLNGGVRMLTISGNHVLAGSGKGDLAAFRTQSMITGILKNGQ